MRTSLTALLLALAAASCTHSDDAQMRSRAVDVRKDVAATPAIALHPAIAPDAADGHVHEYY